MSNSHLCYVFSDKLLSLYHDEGLTFTSDIKQFSGTFLCLTEIGLGIWSVDATQSGQKPYICDFNTQWAYHNKSYLNRSRKNEPFYKACGLGKSKNLNILDATAGFGHDSLLLSFFGANVISIEKNFLISKVLIDGHKRFSSNHFEINWSIYSRDFFELNPDDASCHVIYLDPMYQQHISKALPGKNMQYLRSMDLQHVDVELYVEKAMEFSCQRIVLKRSIQAKTIGKPDISFSGKSTRYDVYLKHQ